VAADLNLQRLTREFGEHTAVDHIDLIVPQGTFFALLGPSGCGKTTTLRMVAGLEEPTSGHIRLGDRDITDLPAYRRPVNTVFQNYALFPHLDVFDNVAFGLKRRKVTDVKKKVEEMLELVELAKMADRKPGQLSGGQQQRVAVARALINEPAVLLLDEPLGALDLKLRRQMQIELKRIQTEVGTTFVHVTHDQEEAMSMADTVAVMNLGKIEQMGDPISVYEHPKTAFVANFLGQANLLKGDIVGQENDHLIIEVHGVKFSLPKSEAPVQSGRIVIGVRPEKITVVDPGVTTLPKNQVVATVIDSSFIGVSTQYLVESPWGQPMIAFEQNRDPTDVARPGDPVLMGWEPRHTFGLDPDEDLLAGLQESVPAL
jgi:spermidine/putrescine transport system ATP-binding protein